MVLDGQDHAHVPCQNTNLFATSKVHMRQLMRNLVLLCQCTEYQGSAMRVLHRKLEDAKAVEEREQVEAVQRAEADVQMVCNLLADQENYTLRTFNRSIMFITPDSSTHNINITDLVHWCTPHRCPLNSRYPSPGAYKFGQ